MEVEILNPKSGKSLGRLSNLTESSTILDVKRQFAAIKPHLYPDRQSFKSDPSGRTLKDDQTLGDLGFTKSNGKLYFKDLGPQVAWTTVFLTEYAGPLVVYLLFWARPSLIYGASAASQPRHLAVTLAGYCWTFHYAKRLAETIFVHRFSHATMPIRNIVKNSTYYWGSAAFVGYFVNHPLFTPPMYGDLQMYAGLAGFIFCELGNFSIHLALRNLRPPGTKVRAIPKVTSNPMTVLFKYVSCPNYTYETGAWLSFSLMTQSLPGLIFTFAGFYQMMVWAQGKHRNYVREFKDYPRRRKAIIPFVI